MVIDFENIHINMIKKKYKYFHKSSVTICDLQILKKDTDIFLLYVQFNIFTINLTKSCIFFDETNLLADKID